MKLGRKGFMLAEVVVVSAVVAGVLVTLFAGLNNVTSAYDVRNRYYDVDSLYAATQYNDILFRNNILLNDSNVNSAKLLYTWLEEQGSGNESDIQNYERFYYHEIGDIISSYITPYDKDKMLDLKNDDIKQTFIDYLDYLSGNLNFNDDFDYMIIVERSRDGNIDDCYYYALKLKY